MPFAEDQDMIQALAAKRPDQAFNIWVLPGRPRCNRTVANSHPSHPVREGLSVRSIIVADEIARCRLPWECFHDLLRQPLRRGMPGYREPQKPSSTMAHDQKGKQALKRPRVIARCYPDVLPPARCSAVVRNAGLRPEPTNPLKPTISPASVYPEANDIGFG
jgi:hypothetical protein